jgi:hypothetical protein
MRRRLSPRGHWLVPRSADAWRIDETSYHPSPSIQVGQIPKRGNSTIGGVGDLRLPGRRLDLRLQLPRGAPLTRSGRP